MLCFILCYVINPVLSCALQWRHNGRDGISNHQPYDCLFNRLYRRRSKKTSKLHVIGLCAGNSPVIGEFPAQMASNAENVSIWWCHHMIFSYTLFRVAPLAGPVLWLHQCQWNAHQRLWEPALNRWVSAKMTLRLSCTNPSKS